MRYVEPVCVCVCVCVRVRVSLDDMNTEPRVDNMMIGNII